MSYNYYYGFDDLFPPGFGIAGTLAAVFVVLIVVWLLLMAYAILSYVLSSLGFYTMAKRRGIRNYGLAWVPIANYWIIGSLADQYDLAVRGRENGYRRKLLTMAIIYCCVCFAVMILSTIWGFVSADSSAGNALSLVPIIAAFFVMMILAVVLMVFYYIALYKVFNSCNPSTSTTFLVLTIVISVTFPFFVFADRNKDLGFPAAAAPAPDMSAGAYSAGPAVQQAATAIPAAPVPEAPVPEDAVPVSADVPADADPADPQDEEPADAPEDDPEGSDTPDA